MATYALIPGGGGDPWEWHRLAAELQARGHEALAIRLPSEDDAAGWDEYADAVVDELGDRPDVVVVAASMGGFTAPIVCTRRPVDGLVLLNAMIPLPGETFNAWWSNTDSGSARRTYHASIGLGPAETDDDAVIYYHDLPSELSAEAQARTWQDQSNTPLEQPWPLPAWPDVPTRVLAGRHDRMFPLEFQRRIARERLGLEVEEVDGGHMVALANPLAVADRLEAYPRRGATRAGQRFGLSGCSTRGRWAGAPDRIRTCDLRLRRPTLYPLSYRRADRDDTAERGWTFGLRGSRIHRDGHADLPWGQRR